MQQTNTITPASAEAVGAAFLSVIPSLSRQGLRLLLAHWAGETGWGRAMHNNNVGNRKGKSSAGDWTQFACGENITAATLAKLKARPDGHLVTVQKTWKDAKGQTWHAVWIEPPHSWSTFAAYPTLAAGARDYLAMMRDTFGKAWAVVERGGTAREFSEALKAQHYYTATVGAYTKLLEGTIAMVETRAPKALAAALEVAKGSVPF